VVLVEDEVFAGPVFEFGVHAVAHDEHGGLLVVVDRVADVYPHLHHVVPLVRRQDIVLLALELDHPGTEVLEFARDLLDDVVHDRVQFAFIGLLEEAHVLLLVVLAVLRLLLALLGLVFAALLVALELHDGGLADDLDHGAFVEDVEYLEFLLE